MGTYIKKSDGLKFIAGKFPKAFAIFKRRDFKLDAETNEFGLSDETREKIDSVDTKVAIADYVVADDSDKWTSAKQYTQGQYAIDNNMLYQKLNGNSDSAHPSASSNWEKVSLSALKNTLGKLGFPNIERKIGEIKGNTNGRFEATENCFMSGYIGSSDTSKVTRLYFDGVQISTAPVSHNGVLIDSATRFYFVPISKGTIVTTVHTDTFSDSIDFYGAK